MGLMGTVSKIGRAPIVSYGAQPKVTPSYTPSYGNQVGGGANLGQNGTPYTVKSLGRVNAPVSHIGRVVDPNATVNPNVPDNHGVIAGGPPPNAVSQAMANRPQMPAFDANDPNNAALAGYMAGAPQQQPQGQPMQQPQQQPTQGPPLQGVQGLVSAKSQGMGY